MCIRDRDLDDVELVFGFPRPQTLKWDHLGKVACSKVVNGNTISSHSQPYYTQPSPNDPTLTSVVLENQIQVQRRLNPGW